MGEYKQIDCLDRNIKFLKFLAVWPTGSGKYYQYYSSLFLIIFVIIYDISYSINLFYIPTQLDYILEDLVLYFTVIATLSKTLTFYFQHDKITKILSIVESDLFQEDSKEAKKIIDDAKKFNIKYWNIVAGISLTSNAAHLTVPLLTYLITGTELQLPVYSCDFLSKNIKDMFIYPLYIYQAIGMNFIVWYNVNTDGIFLGFIRFTIAQLDILDLKLRNIGKFDKDIEDKEEEAIKKLNDCIIHFDGVAKFCDLVQDAFSLTLFIQMGTASMVLCVILFRFTMPAPSLYLVYLVTYMFAMIAQRAVPCWYGTRIIVKSARLAHSVYACDWTPRSQIFKSSMRLLVERVNRPLSIISGKMVVLSLDTLTSIINSAYSFYTLLRHMQSREN
ncbi:odorant receptor 46a-like [Amyelois transitella]|uniref:odorant receptor 46a-like n=1 Tax=Amyelois transitella TaxID=680683 RepID=UPI00067D1F39|nr:odorant receptor 46a-like [Amyelois transitella]